MVSSLTVVYGLSWLIGRFWGVQVCDTLGRGGENQRGMAQGKMSSEHDNPLAKLSEIFALSSLRIITRPPLNNQGKADSERERERTLTFTDAFPPHRIGRCGLRMPSLPPSPPKEVLLTKAALGQDDHSSSWIREYTR